MLPHRSQLLRVFFSTLLLLAPGRSAFAQTHDAGQPVPTLLSWPDSLQPENFRTNLLGYSVSSYDLLISRFDQPLHANRVAEDVPLYLPAFHNLLSLHSNTIQLDTSRAASHLNVLLGSKREQILYLDHRQRLSKAVTWDLSYNSVVSEGYLIHQFSKYKGFRTGLTVRTEKYSLDAGYVFHKVEAEENGGILPGQKTENLSKSDYALLSVNLNDAQSKVRKSDVFLNQSFLLARISEKTTLKLVADAAFTRFRRAYTDTPDTGYFAQTFLDTTATKDTLQLRAWRTSTGLRISGEADSAKVREWSLEAGMFNATDEYLTDTISEAYDNWMPYMKASVAMKSFALEGSIKTTTASSFAGKKDALFADITATADVHARFLSAVRITGRVTSFAPEYNVRQLVSNHFVWHNKAFTNEQATSLEGACSFFDDVVELYGTYEVKKHAVIFNEECMPEELERDNVVSIAGMRFDYRLRHWRLAADVATLHSALDEVPVPDYRLFGRLSYKNTFFKSALTAEFGAACSYSSAYKSLAYQPATGMYFFQSSWSVAGQPNASFFVNLGIGKAILTLQMENLLQGMTGADNYAGPGYPVPPRSLKFGLKWWLVN